MDTSVLLHIALNASGLGVVALTLTDLFLRGVPGTREKCLLAACFGHLFGICADVADHLYAASGGAPLSAIQILHILLSAAAFLSLIFSVFVNETRKLSLHRWGRPFSLASLLAAVLPGAAGLLLSRIFLGVNLFDVFFAFSLGLTDILFQRDKNRELARREEQVDMGFARLMAEQMRPHFIFNVLMSIEDLCYTDGEAAARCIEDFAGYLRGNIRSMTNDELIPFEKELEHVRQYVSLEKTTRGPIFEVVYDIDCIDFSLPALSLQTLVENAIKHGVLSRADGKGCIRIATERKGAFIRVTVADNGTGVKGETEKQREHLGISLTNLEKILATRCSGTFRLTTGPSGSQATMLIPERGDAT